MATIQEDFRVIFEELKTQRDVLAVKIHLAKSDIKDEWQELEKKWQTFCARNHQLQRELRETANDVEDDLHYLTQDLREGYQRLKRLMH